MKFVFCSQLTYIPAPGTDIVPNSIWVSCAIFKGRIFGCWCNTVYGHLEPCPSAVLSAETLLQALLPPPLWEPLLSFASWTPSGLSAGQWMGHRSAWRADHLLSIWWHFFYCWWWGFIVYSLLFTVQLFVVKKYFHIARRDIWTGTQNQTCQSLLLVSLGNHEWLRSVLQMPQCSNKTFIWCYSEGFVWLFQLFQLL